MSSAVKDRTLITARRLYERALLERSAERAGQAVSSALSDGAHPLEIYDAVIIPAQIAVGERWHAGEISISEEHVATQISIEQLNRLRALLKPRPPLHRKVLVGSLSGDQHWLGARIVADHFVHDGWEVEFLGASPPIDDLVEYVERAHPDLLILSITVEADLDIVARLAEKLGKIKNPPRMIIGGRVFKVSAPAHRALKDIPATSDPREALRLGRELCGVVKSDAALEQLLAEIGRKIQTRRKELALSQAQLAERSGLDRAYISAIESGKQNVSIGVLFKLSLVLDLPLSETLQTTH